jgi:hypothetical protein
MPGESAEKVLYHLRLLTEVGFIKAKCHADGSVVLSGLTWQGHEFLDNVKDAGVWEQVKGRLSGLPSAAISVVAEIRAALLFQPREDVDVKHLGQNRRDVLKVLFQQFRREMRR